MHRGPQYGFVVAKQPVVETPAPKLSPEEVAAQAKKNAEIESALAEEFLRKIKQAPDQFGLQATDFVEQPAIEPSRKEMLYLSKLAQQLERRQQRSQRRQHGDSQKRVRNLGQPLPLRCPR